MSTPHAVVIGVGNPMRRDDGVGWAVVDALAAGAEDPGARLVRLDGEPARLVDAWTGAAVAVVVDAVRGGGRAGEVEVEEGFDAGNHVAGRSAAGSHVLGVEEAVALGQALGRLPGRLVLVRVHGTDFGNGEGFSPAVAAAVPTAAVAVRAALGSR